MVVNRGRQLPNVPEERERVRRSNRCFWFHFNNTLKVVHDTLQYSICNMLLYRSHIVQLNISCLISYCRSSSGKHLFLTCVLLYLTKKSLCWISVQFPPSGAEVHVYSGFMGIHGYLSICRYMFVYMWVPVAVFSTVLLSSVLVVCVLFYFIPCTFIYQILCHVGVEVFQLFWNVI